MAQPTVDISARIQNTNIPSQTLIPVDVEGKKYLIPASDNARFLAPSFSIGGRYPFAQKGAIIFEAGAEAEAAKAHYTSFSGSAYVQANRDFLHGLSSVSARFGIGAFSTTYGTNTEMHYGTDVAGMANLRITPRTSLRLIVGGRMAPFGDTPIAQLFAGAGFVFALGNIKESSVENPAAGIMALQDARKALDTLATKANLEVADYDGLDETDLLLEIAEKEYGMWLTKRNITWGRLPKLNETLDQFWACVNYAKTSIPSNANMDGELKSLIEDLESFNYALAMPMLKILVFNNNSVFYKLQRLASSIKTAIAKRDVATATEALESYQEFVARLHTQFHLIVAQLPKNRAFVVEPYQKHIDCWRKGSMCASGTDNSSSVLSLQEALDKIAPPTPPKNKVDEKPATPVEKGA